jgi:4a-hydroxytetrahydrobiopterin dehydratase
MELEKMGSVWKNEDDKLKGEFLFKDFVDAFAFMTKIALISEKQNHHPLLKNMYNKVWVELSTHDAGNVVTEKDIQLAKAIDKIYHV